jgi:DNA repair protein RadC
MKVYSLKTKVIKTLNESLSSNELPSLMKSQQDAYQILSKLHEENMNIQEEVYALFLNRNNQVIGYELLFKGGSCECVMDIHLLAWKAISYKAKAVIMSHNHPSGGLKPSQSDIKVTDEIKAGLSLLKIDLLDHLIITENGFKSILHD